MEKEFEETKRKTPLEMFKEVKDLEVADSPLMTVEDCLPFMCEKVEQSLLELKAIKEAKPSEALRCLEELRSNLGVIYDDTLNTIEQALLKARELEKENTELNQHIKRWHDLLLKTGINSKGTVVDEIENYWTIKAEAKK